MKQEQLDQTLAEALNQGDEKKAILCIMQGANVNQIIDNGVTQDTPLTATSLRGMAVAAHVILDRNPDVLLPDGKGVRTLICASQNKALLTRVEPMVRAKRPLDGKIIDESIYHLTRS